MARRKIEYKLYIYDKENHQRFYSESFRTRKEAREYFNANLRDMATRACIMEYNNDLNTRNWYWGYDRDSWV